MQNMQTDCWCCCPLVIAVACQRQFADKIETQRVRERERERERDRERERERDRERERESESESEIETGRDTTASKNLTNVKFVSNQAMKPRDTYPKGQRQMRIHFFRAVEVGGGWCYLNVSGSGCRTRVLVQHSSASIIK